MNCLNRFICHATLLLLTMMLTSLLSAEEIKKTFEGVKEVRIKTVSGDCFIQKGDSKTVEVVVSHTYSAREFEAEFDQSGSQLLLQEHFLGRHSSGRSVWRVTAPEDTDIEFSTSSGSLEIVGLKSDIEAKMASGNATLKNLEGNISVGTASGGIDAQNVHGKLKFGSASGDIQVRQASGELEFGTASGSISTDEIEGTLKFGAASGNIDIEKATGAFDIGAASGNVTVDVVTLTGPGKFNAASGDVEVTLAKSPEHDLEISAASGDAILNFSGNPVRGYIEMTAQVQRGDIHAPFKFDHEETYYEGNREYITKSVQKGSRPKIKLSTGSGKAVLRN